MVYLEKGVQPDYPNLSASLKINDEQELKAVLRKKISTAVTTKKLLYDLVNFFGEQEFISSFCKNYKIIIGKYLNN